MTNRPNTASELAALRATVEHSITLMERDRRDAKEQRDEMAKDVAETKDNTARLSNRVDNLEGSMAKVTPVIDKVNGWHSMVLGGLIVLGFLGGAVTIFWEAVREKITAIFTGS